MTSILFVCTGDTCRSAMCATIFNQKLKARGIKKAHAKSAGLYVTVENKMHEDAKKALKKLGYRVPRHTATQLTVEMVPRFNFVITMTADQRLTICGKVPQCKNVYSFANIVGGTDIDDPYGKGENVYYNVARQIEAMCERLIDLFLKEGIIK